MKTLPKSLDMELFLIFLHALTHSSEKKWKPRLERPYGEKNGLIRLKLDEDNMLFSPLSAVYYYLTGIKVMNSFLMPEMIPFFTLESGEKRWWEIIDISYASDACDVSRLYNRDLRNCLLGALGLPLEKR